MIKSYMVIGKDARGYSTVECIKHTYNDAKEFAESLNEMGMIVVITLHDQLEFVL